MKLLDVTDSLFYYMKEEENPCFSNNIFVFFNVEGRLEDDFIYRKVESCIENNGRLKEIVRNKMNNLVWENHNVIVKNHVKIINRKKYSSQKHKKLVDKIINTKYVDEQPEWMIYFVRYPEKTCVIFACSHMIGDGYYLIEKLSKSFFDNPSFIQKKKKKKKGFSLLNILKSIYFFIISGFSLFYNFVFYKKEKIFDKIDKNKVCWDNLYTFDIKKLKKIKEKNGITMNDLLYSLILKALKKYSNKEHINISSSTVFNLRNLNKTLKDGNEFGFVTFSTKVDDSIFGNINKKMNQIKSSPLIPCIINIIKCLFHFSCPSAIKLISRGINQNHFGYSNLHSYLDENTINNYKVSHISNIVTPYKYNLFISGLSYYDKITLNFTYKHGILDAKRFKKCMKEVVENLNTEKIT